METDDRMPSHFIKHVRNGIYEIRISIIDKEARLMFFYDGPQLVVICNCFIKKTQKTPEAVIDKAERLRKEYYDGRK